LKQKRQYSQTLSIILRMLRILSAACTLLFPLLETPPGHYEGL